MYATNDFMAVSSYLIFLLFLELGLIPNQLVKSTFLVTFPNLLIILLVTQVKNFGRRHLVSPDQNVFHFLSK